MHDDSPTPVSARMRAAGNWNPAWDVPAQLDAAETRQHDVENGQIILSRLQKAPARLPVLGQVAGMQFSGQLSCERPGNASIIFH